jgi:GNAT superfamily N-acetyltransferase
MIKCYALEDNKKDTFERLFTEYYEELGCDEDVDHLLDEYILADYSDGLISIDLIDDEDKTVGFVIYQIDAENNEWHTKVGMGDIREIYVAPSCRRQGLGKFMLNYAHAKLSKAGATGAYALPTEDCEGFFTACGYKDSGEYNEDLDINFYIVENLK